jgi:hypothetical protein
LAIGEVLVAGLLPPGEKRFKVAAALGLLDIDRLEGRTHAKLQRLREQGGPRGRRMTISEIAAYLEDRGEHTSVAWLSEAFASIQSHDPAA